MLLRLFHFVHTPHPLPTKLFDLSQAQSGELILFFCFWLCPLLVIFVLCYVTKGKQKTSRKEK